MIFFHTLCVEGLRGLQSKDQNSAWSQNQISVRRKPTLSSSFKDQVVSPLLALRFWFRFRSSTKTSSTTQVAIHWTPQTQRPLVWTPNVAWTPKVLQRPQGWTPKVAIDWTPQRPFQSSLDWMQNVAIASTAARPFQRPLDWRRFVQVVGAYACMVAIASTPQTPDKRRPKVAIDWTPQRWMPKVATRKTPVASDWTKTPLAPLDQTTKMAVPCRDPLPKIDPKIG